MPYAAKLVRPQFNSIIQFNLVFWTEAWYKYCFLWNVYYNMSLFYWL